MDVAISGGGGAAQPQPETKRRMIGSDRGQTLALAAAGTGLFLVAMGLLSSILVIPDFYRDFLSGYDPPFDALAGVLLLALSFRIAEQSLVAWAFSLLAPALTICDRPR